MKAKGFETGGNMNKKSILLIVLVAMMAVLLTGCLPGDSKYTSDDPAGFFWGIWHGWLAPLSLIISLFNDTTRVYEVNNTGWWYDFGFYIAIISGFGGVRLSRKASSSKSKSEYSSK